MTKCAHTSRDAACSMAKARTRQSHQRWHPILQSYRQVADNCQRRPQILLLQTRCLWTRPSQTLARLRVASLAFHPSPIWQVLGMCLHKSEDDQYLTDLAQPRWNHATLGLQMSDRFKTSSGKSSSSKRSGGNDLIDAAKPKLAPLFSKLP